MLFSSILKFSLILALALCNALCAPVWAIDDDPVVDKFQSDVHVGNINEEATDPSTGSSEFPNCGIGLAAFKNYLKIKQTNDVDKLIEIYPQTSKSISYDQSLSPAQKNRLYECIYRDIVSIIDSPNGLNKLKAKQKYTQDYDYDPQSWLQMYIMPKDARWNYYLGTLYMLNGVYPLAKQTFDSLNSFPDGYTYYSESRKFIPRLDALIAQSDRANLDDYNSLSERAKAGVRGMIYDFTGK